MHDPETVELTTMASSSWSLKKVTQMNKPKPTMKQKLALTAETVRAISATNLGSVAGGMMARSYRQCQTEEINCQYTH